MRHIFFILLAFCLIGTSLAAHAPAKRQPALIELNEPGDLATLSRLGLDIDSVWPGFARVYVTPEEFNKVSANGYYIEWIPDQAHEQFEKLWAATKNSADKLGAYHTYAELTTDLQAVAAAHPDICQLVSAGQSVQGRNLWVMKISDNVATAEDEPEIEYISTIHGDEPVGTEMLVDLLHDLVDNYGTDALVTQLVDETEIYLLPMMNPDGNSLGQRYNANGVDLNRNFPDRISDPVNTITGRQPETAAVMTFFGSRTPVIGANFHTGALVVNYPWDHGLVPSGSYAMAPDDDVFIHISEVYSSTNLPMWDNPQFPHGITNGSDWYVAIGGLQDWSYYWGGNLALTIELSNTKWPDPSALSTLWSQNQDSLLDFMAESLQGVRGVITDSVSGDPVAATVTVEGRDMPFYTDPDVGDYHRRLLPGIYSLQFSADGYQTRTVDNVIVTDSAATRLDVSLQPNDQLLLNDFSLTEISGNGDTVMDPGETWAAAITLHNGGASTYHGVDVGLTLSGTPADLLSDNWVAGDLSSGASASSPIDQFRFHISAQAQCGAELTFAFEIQSAEITYSYSFNQLLGTISDTTFASTDTPLDIPDNTAGGVTSTIQIGNDSAVHNLEVHLDITHPYKGDLTVALTSPEGTRIVFIDREGGSGDNIVGDFALPQFDGESLAGSWQLQVADLAASDTGTLNSWSLTVPLAECNPWSANGDVNLDGQVNSTDFVLLAQWLAGNLPAGLTDSGNADLDNDGRITVVDLTLLMLVLL